MRGPTCIVWANLTPFSLKWSGDDHFGDKHGNAFSFPAIGCNNMKKMVLRSEWNDYPMVN